MNEGIGRIYKRKDGKFLVYIPLDVATDSMFPFKNFRLSERGVEFIPVKVRFETGDNKLIIEPIDER